MFDLILDTAREDERIRAVILNGSRANPSAPRDIFQDFDIVYLVTDVTPFRKNLEWIARFGELMILQMPEDMQDPPADDDGHFGYLMQFTDGNRIDLGVFPLTSLPELRSDSLSLLLLDKDGTIEPFPPASESAYIPNPPIAKAFADCCNEFWWVCPYVAKGLWRQEITYAHYMLDSVVREQLMKMLTWHIGVRTHFEVNPGKQGKYFQKYLEPELWDLLQETYADAGYERTWQALFAMSRLFKRTAIPLASKYGFTYSQSDDDRVSAHLQHVHSLPRDATQIY